MIVHTPFLLQVDVVSFLHQRLRLRRRLVFELSKVA
jgi:hypothetical protein